MKTSSIKSYSTDNSVVATIYAHGRGWVFTPDDFKGVGTRDAVASALKRHKQTGLIRQLAHGLYDYPRMDARLGALSPASDDVAKALARRDTSRLQPSGAYAANLLGLSTQVPMKMVYLTDGRSRTVQIDKRQIILKQTAPRYMATAGRISGLVIQALRYLGRDQVDESVVAALARRLDEPARKQLMKDIRYAPAWIAAIFRRLAERSGS